MLNWIWLGLMLCGFVMGASQGLLKEVTDGALEGAKNSVTLAIGLTGMMALWLGVMRLAEQSGLIRILARGLRPLLTRLFPDVPPDHPAMGSMLMNIAANMLGLSNAATPLGLRAMKDLERLNRTPGVATNAMCTFLAINTSSVQLIPASAIAILVSAGSKNPTAIVGTALIATLVSTAVGITAVKLFEKMRVFRIRAIPGSAPKSDAGQESDAETTPVPLLALTRPKILLLLAFALFSAWSLSQIMIADAATVSIPLSGVNAISLIAVPLILCFFPLYAALRGIRVYEEFVEGAKEGFQVAIRIIPFLVAILAAIGMFRGAGGIDFLTSHLRSLMEAVRFPPELLPMCLMRPLSGGGTMGIFAELVQHHGPDSLIARTAATIFGSTETTFYVVSVYFGSVAVRSSRHAIPAGLLADLAGMIASVAICRMVFA